MKQIVRAFSLGLLTASLIIGIVYYLAEDRQKDNETVEDGKDILTEAQEQGYFIYDTDMEEKIAALETEIANLSEDQTADQNSDTADKEVVNFMFRIDQGMKLPQIVDQLEQYNLIDNRNDFITYLEENQLTRLIQPGEFLINNQMSVEEIAAHITKTTEAE
ncbi:endolytic transglycosylase MltG [Gracilibacillus oryzae]|uniref:Endolytic transglycosylase MltG n=1 Tax=Gracilibacillus oryzae TaxID=1672701 RepID=A0A7C8L252_9BACI|nr:endolytic transglycosylase MltG [Gracilibacillus oryzae]KAB8128432.1 endolytic transglycosylase MltG [Gracilibacillus oryzae]